LVQFEKDARNKKYKEILILFFAKEKKTYKKQWFDGDG